MNFTVHDGSSILFQLHGHLSRSLALHLNMSFEGLAQGARICRKLGIVTNRAAKKMTDVDITFNMMKHMNAIRAKDFAIEMQEGMILPAGAKKAASEKETNLEEESKNKAAAPSAPTPVGKTVPAQAGQSGTSETKKDEEQKSAAPLAKGQAGQSGPKNALFPTCRQLQAGVVPNKKGKQDEKPTVKGQQQPQQESANRAPQQAQAAVGPQAPATATTAKATPATASSRQTSPNSHTCQVCKARGEQTTKHAFPLATKECQVCWTPWPRELPVAAFTPALARQRIDNWFNPSYFNAFGTSSADAVQQEKKTQRQPPVP